MNDVLRLAPVPAYVVTSDEFVTIFFMTIVLIDRASAYSPRNIVLTSLRSGEASIAAALLVSNGRSTLTHAPLRSLAAP